ncbi:MAG: hypothetical protein QG597_700, partial [Actinomycetota bacterium]|nr:hypothetical protein [Actinomycetota bacterium]
GSPPQLGSALQLAAILAAAALANALALVSTMLRYLRGVQYQPTRDPLTPNAPIIGPGELRVLETPSWWLGPLAPWPTAVVGALAFFGVTALVWWWLTHNATAAAPGAQADVHAGTTTPTATEANVGAPPA